MSYIRVSLKGAFSVLSRGASYTWMPLIPIYGTYQSDYNIVPPYLYELINKKESHVNACMGTDHISLLCRQLVKIVRTVLLNVHSFMLLHVNGTN